MLDGTGEEPEVRLEAVSLSCLSICTCISLDERQRIGSGRIARLHFACSRNAAPLLQAASRAVWESGRDAEAGHMMSWLLLLALLVQVGRRL